MSIIGRLEEYISYKNISIRQFEINIGTSNGVIHNAIKNEKDIRSSWISKIIDKYPDINIEWLVTGRGSMLAKNVTFKGDEIDYANEFALNLRQEIKQLRNRIEKLEQKEQTHK